MKLKIGSTFLAAIELTEDEWDYYFPTGEEIVRGQMKQGGQRYDLVAESNAALRVISLVSPTDSWRVGFCEFDVKVTRGSVKSHLPQLSNYKLEMIEGATL